MSNVRISDMPFATLPLTGIELVEVTQGGFSRQTTVTAFSTTSITPIRITLPQTDEPATPTLSFGDGDTGLYEDADDNLVFATAGASAFEINVSGHLNATNTDGPSIRRESPSASNPTLIPDKTDVDTGIGMAGADQLSLIAGGLDCINIAETGSVRQVGFYVTSPISLQTGVAVSAAGIHAALVNLGLITA